MSNLCCVIIRPCDQVGFVTTGEVINTIDPFQMRIQCEIGVRRTKIPYLKIYNKYINSINL